MRYYITVLLFIAHVYSQNTCPTGQFLCITYSGISTCCNDYCECDPINGCCGTAMRCTSDKECQKDLYTGCDDITNTCFHKKPVTNTSLTTNQQFSDTKYIPISKSLRKVVYRNMANPPDVYNSCNEFENQTCVDLCKTSTFAHVCCYASYCICHNKQYVCLSV